jgi:hypothetical protein
MTTKTDLPTELESIASDEKLMQIARKAIEDELVEWRDECRFMMRNNGFAIRNRDGSSSTIIRFGSEYGLRIALRAIAAHLAEKGDG